MTARPAPVDGGFFHTADGAIERAFVAVIQSHLFLQALQEPHGIDLGLHLRGAVVEGSGADNADAAVVGFDELPSAVILRDDFGLFEPGEGIGEILFGGGITDAQLYPAIEEKQLLSFGPGFEVIKIVLKISRDKHRWVFAQNKKILSRYDRTGI